ncbi:hypothetical protein [Paenibacillus sp. FSL L8-0689]
MKRNGAKLKVLNGKTQNTAEDPEVKLKVIQELMSKGYNIVTAM